MKRFTLLAAVTSLLLAIALPGRAAAEAPPQKVLRYAFRVAESGFDPAELTDLYSIILASNIYDAPLEFAYLGKPGTLRPNTLAEMPEVSPDFKTFTFRLKPGIYFDDDPAFGGKKRELVAADYVYSIKRFYDPRWKSGRLFWFTSNHLLGLDALRERALKTGHFDYDTPVDGVRALDRYTFQIRLGAPNPRFLYVLADPGLAGAVAREVVERYGDRVNEHPVGTGPFRLAEWRRASRIVLERNPNYRARFYDETPPPGDARLQAIAARFKGRRLPMIDRVEISIIEENQPRWLAFLNNEHDMAEIVPWEYVEQVAPHGRLSHGLARRGIQLERYTRDTSYTYFSMDDPVVGGYEPAKVALRRAISLGIDIDKQIRLGRYGEAIPAQSLVSPSVWGYDPAFKSEMSDFDRARAKALLDLYGYVDRDGDGWRDQPDGSPLVITYSMAPDQETRRLAELLQKNLQAIGIRMNFNIGQWPALLKQGRAGKLMMWSVAWAPSTPDAEDFLTLAYGPSKGQSNFARFDLPAFNTLFDRLHTLPDGPERQADITQANKLLVAYMPYRAEVHRIYTDMTQPWVKGYHRNVFVRDFWRYIDIDTDELKRRTGQ